MRIFKDTKKGESLTCVFSSHDPFFYDCERSSCYISGIRLNSIIHRKRGGKMKKKMKMKKKIFGEVKVVIVVEIII